MSNCDQCNHPFEVRGVDLEFYSNFDVPAPRMCPSCRLQQRLCFRNERTLYKRQSSLSGRGIVSIYAADTAHPVYSPEEWWGDGWEGLEYGRDVDFSRPFFEQFADLARTVPRIALFNVNPDNSDYCQQAYNNKNCYLCVVVKNCQDSMYVSHSNRMIDCYDCSHMQDSQLCYECADSDKLYECIACQSCQNSNNLVACLDCIGCHYCIGCSGLRNKRYYVKNVQVSKEEYERSLRELNLGSFSSYSRARDTLEEVLRGYPHRENSNINTEECVGNYLLNSRRSYRCFDAFQLEDCAYSTWIFESKDGHDIYGCGTSELVYYSVGIEKLHRGAFNTFVSDSNDAFYSDLCFYCANIFGCVGLKKKRNCVLNRQYSAEEYQALTERLITHMKESGEWGLFFPIALSPFCYNETAAQEHFPLTREEALAHGFRWHEPDKKDLQPQRSTVPDSIGEVSDAVVNEVLACGQCKKNFKVQPTELHFYRKMNLPIPHHCMECRYFKRAWSRNPGTLWNRPCGQCKKAIQTSYAPARKERVLCESCYQTVVN